MPRRKQSVNKALKGPGEWREYLATLSLTDLANARTELQSAISEWGVIVEDLQYALSTLESTVKSRQDEAEAEGRKQRRARAALSLGEFLSQPHLDIDVALRDLPLCTGTGATVRLEGLFFTADGKEFEVTTANEAKQFFQRGLVPKAGYRLFYVRDGERSAGFGWERPFLKELFLLEK